MTWLKWLLAAIALVLMLMFAIVAGLGLLTADEESQVRHIPVGQRTITVSHYKSLTQDTTADGVKIVADGHTIMATPDAISIDGKTQNFDPTQDVEITIDESGAMQAKVLSAAAPGPNDEDAPSGGDSDASPPQ
jgi:hypothetical protein